MAGVTARALRLEPARFLWATVAALCFVASTEALFGPVQCPGLKPGLLSLECQASCQLATCDGLVSFFKSTYNATTAHLRSWRNKNGWQSVLTMDCTQILSIPTADGTPSYCSWPGVTCCSRPAQFMGYCNITNALVQLKVEANGLNGSISDPEFEKGIGQLHACGLLSLVLSGNALSGTMSAFWGQLTNLLELTLAKNMIEGTLPEALRDLTKLQGLTMDRNPMYGTVPEWLPDMRSVYWLGLSSLTGRHPDGRQGLVGTIPESLGSLRLEALSLDSNSLTGPMPSSLCRPGNVIKFLLLRGNRIKGNFAQLLPCQDAVFLDMRNNKFSGTLPDLPSWGWRNLSILDMRGNELEGTLPKAVFDLGASSLLLGNNRLNGTIPSIMGMIQSLMRLSLENNQLSGTIDEGLWYMPRLENLELSGNQFTGTISPAVGYSYYLTFLRLDNNKLSGVIPSVLGFLPGLLNADLRNNSFSHLTSSHNISEHRAQGDAQILPCYLSLSDYTMPLPDASNMECPAVLRKPHEQASQDCFGSDVTQLGPQASGLPVDVPVDQAWHIDPSYSLYTGCRCLGGYQAVWNSDNTVLVCERIPAELPSWLVPLSAVLFSVFILFLAAVGLLVWLKLTVQLRRKWQREKELNNNRLKGVPNGGPAAIVVTDVERYSDMMQMNAAVTTRAMGIHNAILRKAVTTHAGHVIEQEGDSWSVAFHRPVDAVAFCLQVQQALQRTHWPDELGNMLANRSGPEKTPEPLISGSALSHTSQATAEISIRPQARHSIESNGATSLLGARGDKQIDSVAHQKHGSGPGGDSLANRVSSMLQHLMGKGGSKVSPDLGSEYDASDGHMTMKLDERAPAAHRRSVDSLASYDRATAVTSVSKAAGSTASRLKGKHVKMASGEVLGLRVRMAIASGWVPAGSDIKVSAVFALAKAVSDMANGGQILMESWTADAVRDWLSDLGCVDHKGYNDKLLSTSHNQAARINTNGSARWLISLMSCALRVTINERDPICLDMGQFWTPSLLNTLQAVQAAVRAGEATTTINRQRSTLAQRRNGASRSADNLVADVRQGSMQLAVGPVSSKQCQKACVAIVASALGRGAGACCGTPADALYLFSIIAHPLHGRSKIWRNDLNLKEDTQQIMKGYFAAPGTQMADLSSAATAFLDIQRPLLPPVTMVFAAVDEARLLRKKEAVARTVFNAMGKVLQALLLSFPDGYLCREQEAVLKYMVAFREPARAAEWCLLVQEVLQSVPWPAEVMETFNSGAFHPSRSTAGATRASGCGGMQRPSLKMGLAEGVPDSISPDHMGRADYFGTSVNLAARIMSAAAHSGQVVMSAELAESIFSAWRYEAELGMHTVPEESKVPGGGGDDWQQFSLSGANEGQHEGDKRPAPVEGGSAVSTVVAARMPAALQASLTAADAEQQSTTTRVVRVSAHHVGTYAFKGCGALDMVCLTSDAIIGMAAPQAVAPPTGSKGTLVMAAAGPVVGMQDYPVILPDVLSEIQQAWGNRGAPLGTLP